MVKKSLEKCVCGLKRLKQNFQKKLHYLEGMNKNKILSINLIKVMLLISVFSSLSILKFLSSTFLDFGSSLFHSNYSIWVLLFSFFIVSLSGLYKFFWKFNKHSIMLFLLPITLLLQENIGYVLSFRHYGLYYIEFFFWFALLYFIIERILLSRKDLLVSNLYFLYKCYITLCLFVSIFFIINKVVFPENPYINTGFLFGENHISYVATSAVLLLLYYPFRFFKKPRNKNIALALLIATPLAVGNIGGIVAITSIWLLYLKAWKALLTISVGLIYLYMHTGDNGLYQFYLMFTYGMTFDPLLDPNYVLNLNSQLTSTYIRNATNMIAIEEFLNNPLFGTGLYRIKQELRYAGYWSHSWLLITLASYGIFSFILVLSALYCSSGCGNNFKKHGYGVLVILSIMTGVFVPEVYLFFTVLFILYRFINIVNNELTSKTITSNTQ